MRLPITLAPVRSNVSRAMSLSRPSSPPSPSFRFSRKNRRGKTHCCSSIHCAVQRCLPGSSMRSAGAMNPSSDIVTLKNTWPAISSHSPNDLGDVGGQVAQGLLAALDRVVLLGRLVPQLPGREHRAHLDPGRRAVGGEGDDRLEGVRVAAGLAVQQGDPLRRGDLGPGDPLLVVGPVRSVHHEVPLPADAELERPRGGGEPLRSPPPRQVPHLGERLEHQLQRCADHPRDHDLAVGRRGLRRRVLVPSCSSATPPAFPA